VREALENLGLQMPPKDKLAPEAPGKRRNRKIKWWPTIEATDFKVD
jgi:hypothetical protein